MLHVLASSIRVEIRKGLNSLHREIPGGDTCMDQGLQLVGLGGEHLEHLLAGAGGCLYLLPSSCYVKHLTTPVTYLIQVLIFY